MTYSCVSCKQKYAKMKKTKCIQGKIVQCVTTILSRNKIIFIVFFLGAQFVFLKEANTCAKKRYASPLDFVKNHAHTQRALPFNKKNQKSKNALRRRKYFNDSTERFAHRHTFCLQYAQVGVRYARNEKKKDERLKSINTRASRKPQLISRHWVLFLRSRGADPVLALPVQAWFQSVTVSGGIVVIFY